MIAHLRLFAQATALLSIIICWIPLCAGAEPLHIFTWRADTAEVLPGTVAMLWAHPEIYRPAGQEPTTKPAAEVAKAVATQLNKYPSGMRVLIISFAGILVGPNGEPSLFPRDNRLIQAYSIGGFTKFTTEWMTAFWQSLKAAGALPDFIVIDYEDAAGIWGLQTVPPPNAIPIAGAPTWASNMVATMNALNQQIGHSPTGYSALDYVRQGSGWQWNVTAVDAFNQWFGPRRSAALRTSIFQPAWQVFGTEIASADYGEQRRAWPGVDSNGWLLNDQQISGTWSSPFTYLLTTGGRYSAPKDPKSRDSVRALEWLDRRNDVRAAYSVSANVAPWYSNPDFGLEAGEDPTEHRLRWAAGMLYDRSIGISTMFFWSAQPWTDDEVKFAKPILKYLATASTNPTVTVDRLSESSAQEILNTWANLARQILPVRPMYPVLNPIH